MNQATLAKEGTLSALNSLWSFVSSALNLAASTILAKISLLNQYQTIWTNIKKDECHNRKNDSAICEPNFKWDLRENNHQTSHVAKEADDLAIFNEELKTLHQLRLEITSQPPT